MNVFAPVSEHSCSRTEIYCPFDCLSTRKVGDARTHLKTVRIEMLSSAVFARSCHSLTSVYRILKMERLDGENLRMIDRAIWHYWIFKELCRVEGDSTNIQHVPDED